MVYSNFENLNSFNGIFRPLNNFHIEKIIEEKKYLKLSNIENKYLNIFHKWENYIDFYKIRKEVICDFGHNKTLLTYLSLIFKEKYLSFIYKKISLDSYYRKLKILILTHFFIATIRYGEKIYNKSINLQCSNELEIKNFRIYAFLVNPMFFYNHLQILTFDQASILKKLLDVSMNWGIDKTFKHFSIYSNYYLDIKLFNLEKEIIKKTNDDKQMMRKEYADLIYDTYMKLLVKFTSKNIEKHSKW